MGTADESQGISEDMRIMRKLKRGTIVLTYIIFLCGWTFRVVFIDLAHMNEYLSWTIGFHSSGMVASVCCVFY